MLRFLSLLRDEAARRPYSYPRGAQDNVNKMLENNDKLQVIRALHLSALLCYVLPPHCMDRHL
jgi:hypothetical protein